MRATTNNDGSVLIAPTRLVADTRDEFRTTALTFLEHLAQDAGALVIDMENTVDVDASGLGVLILVQKRAKERELSTRLRHAPERVRNLLNLTKLDFLFELTN